MINNLLAEAEAARCESEPPGDQETEAGGAPDQPLGASPVASPVASPIASPIAGPGRADGRVVTSSRSVIEEAREKVQPVLIERIDPVVATRLPRKELARQVGEIVGEIVGEQKLKLNQIEQRDLVTGLLNEMLGLGPLEPLLADDEITDIMVNGPYQVYVERRGKLELTDVKFKDNTHVMNIATRIVTKIGRRIDESSPLVDARLEDGSRVNIIAPPLAIDGTSISIRKFAKKSITLDIMEGQRNISPAMAKVLKIASRCRLNVLISGGTGSGKTTLLNALSQMIDGGERVVTIEDAAELQLQQPHVVRLETRPANLEGQGQIDMRDLVKNALRMRPDRIILGEVRGAEALDMLQAMNTGHDGSLGTVHANNPREGLTRLENMVAMAGVNWPTHAVRNQIAGALDLIVQVSRMRDGVRRVTRISEVVGMEGEVITTQDLFTFEFTGEGADGRLQGDFKWSGLRPHFTEKARYFGLDRALLDALD
ncbi:MAG: CpaF family protein [Alphaproteobacteria bacterium]